MAVPSKAVCSYAANLTVIDFAASVNLASKHA